MTLDMITKELVEMFSVRPSILKDDSEEEEELQQPEQPPNIMDLM